MRVGNEARGIIAGALLVGAAVAGRSFSSDYTKLAEKSNSVYQGEMDTSTAGTFLERARDDLTIRNKDWINCGGGNGGSWCYVAYPKHGVELQAATSEVAQAQQFMRDHPGSFQPYKENNPQKEIQEIRAQLIEEARRNPNPKNTNPDDIGRINTLQTQLAERASAENNLVSSLNGQGDKDFFGIVGSIAVFVGSGIETIRLLKKK